MTKADDARFMALALSLGRRGMGRVWPNPAVGCVIVRDGVIVGRGRTADGGRPHAETQALAMAGDGARGATVYVTLEPCSHHGQTAPCADALVAAGVARVVVATGDPDLRVSGRGIARLTEAGIAVDVGISEADAKDDHTGFLLNTCDQRPFLTLKLATTLDGRIATRTGDSQWITGPDARRVVHAMRARHDAIMVGAGTVRADDPSLNVRGMGDVPQPVRVIVSTRADLAVQGNLAATINEQPVWICHGAAADPVAWATAGAQAIACDAGPDGDGVDVTSVLGQLAHRGITRVFCEGGGALAASLLKAGCVDELVLFQGGLVIGSDGTPAIGGLGTIGLSDAPGFALITQCRVGKDVMQRWRAIAT